MKTKTLLAASCMTALIGLAAVGAAQADTVYTSRALFNAATGSNTVITFNGIAAANSFVAYNTGPLTLSGITFNGNGSMFVIDPGYYGSSYSGGGFLNSDYATINIITSNLPNVHDVGFDFGGLSGPAAFTVTLSDGSVFTPTSLNSITGTSALDFFGVTSSSPITSISISMPDAPNYNAIDNFTFGTSAVPEPATWAMLLVGIAGLGGMIRSRRRMATASA